MLRLLLVLLFSTSFNPLIIYSKDNSRLDSLETLLELTHNINDKFDICIHLIREYRSTDIEKSKYFANQALNIAVGTGSETNIGRVYGSLGDIAIAQDSVEIASAYYNLALGNYQEAESKDGIISILTILGNIAFIQDDLSEALQYYHKAIKLAQEGDFQRRLQRLYLNVGSIMIKSNQYIESQEYTSRALKIFLEMGDSLEIANAYSNLGTIYSSLQDNNAAQKYFIEALNIYKNLDASISVASTTQRLAEVERKMGNYNKAIDMLLSAKNQVKENMIAQFEGPKQLLLNTINVALGENYLLSGNSDKAYYYLINGYQKSIQYHQLELSGKAARYLFTYWNEKSNADSALYYHQLYKNYSDSLHEEVNNRKLALQEAQFNFEQQSIKENQERQKQEEKQKRNLIILIVTVVILILVLLLLLTLLRLNRIKMKDSELEQESLRNELDLKNKELTTYLIYQVKNNEFIVNISDKLKKILWKSSDENKSLVHELIKEIETDSSSDNWDEFIVRFQQVHTDFYKNLGEKYPDLTSNELRLCAFLKLNMNTKDIAAITYQSTKSITVARWRLRQKLGLRKEERLAAFLTKF